MFHFLLRNIPRPFLIRLSWVFSKIAPFVLKGNNVECPVCNNTYRTFLPYGYGGSAKRKNVLCPHCLSLERHRLLWLYLKNKTDFFTTKRNMLHIAPEQYFYKKFKKLPNLNYLTGDLFSPLADVKFDLHKAPFEDNKFDVIFCNHVLEHVENDFQCMKELYRILKPGGFAILQVPIDFTRDVTFEDPAITSQEDREKHFWQKDHVRLYGKDYPKKLQNAGFNVKVENYLSEFSQEQKNRYRLPFQEEIYVAMK